MKPGIIIIGVGGHGKVVMECVKLQGKYEIHGLVDDQLPAGTDINGYKVICNSNNLSDHFNSETYFIVAIGNNKIRSELFNDLSKKFKPASIFHPSAIVSPSCTIGSGSVVLAGSVINPGVVIGADCIINAMCLIDHDTSLGEHVHVAQGSIVGSHVKISSGYTTKLGDRLNSLTTY